MPFASADAFTSNENEEVQGDDEKGGVIGADHLQFQGGLSRRLREQRSIS